MANDYRRHYRDEDFLITLRDNNKIGTEYLYPKGYTGYEKYYIDFEMNLSQGIVAYWRELYNPDVRNSELRDEKVHYQQVKDKVEMIKESELED